MHSTFVPQCKYNSKYSINKEYCENFIYYLMSAIERLREFIEYKGISKYSFYKATGLSNGYLDKGGNIGSDKCEIISSVYPDLNLVWLITGKGEMLNLESSKIEETPEPISDPELSRHIDELTEVIKTQAKALLEQQQFINAHFPTAAKNLD